MAKDPGPCLSYMTRWYFNTETRRCEQFVYGGCQGNRNKFLTERECISECGEEEPEPTPSPSPVPPVGPTDGAFLPSVLQKKFTIVHQVITSHCLLVFERRVLRLVL